MATLLENIQLVCIESGLQSPTAAATNNNKTVKQLIALMNRLGESLLTEFDWQRLQVQYIFSTEAQQISGTTSAGSNIVTGTFPGITVDFVVSGTGIPQDARVVSVGVGDVTINQSATVSGTSTLTFARVAYPLPSDFMRFCESTGYDKTAQVQLYGGKHAAEWQLLKSTVSVAALSPYYRIIGDNMELYPPPANGLTLGYEYIGKNHVTSALDVKKEKFTEDTDTSLFPDRLLVMGTKMLFWQTKGFDSSVFERDYQRELSKYTAQQSSSEVLDMSGTRRRDFPYNRDWRVDA